MQIKARDNSTISYTLFGAPHALHRIVLVHSLAMDRTFWSPVIEQLGEECCILAYDCRGHGRSSKPAGPYSIDVFADDLADLLDAIGWRQAIVAGASMGGTVSIAFAEQYPERVKGLGLFDTTAWYGPTAPQDWADRASKAASEGLASLVGFQKTRWFSDAFRAARPDIEQASLDIFLHNDISAYVATCHMLGNADLRAGLPALKMPVRILVGDEDFATPVAMAQALHEAIADSSLNIVKGARHLTPLEIPQTIAAELRALMR